MAKSDGVPKTGPVKRNSLRVSLALYAEAKRKKKAARLEKKLARKR